MRQAKLLMVAVLSLMVTSCLADTGVPKTQPKEPRASATTGSTSVNRGSTSYRIGKPYPCGDPATLAQAQGEYIFAIYIPEHPLANESRVEGVSNCPGIVIIYFDSGVKVFIEKEASPPEDPAAFWQKLADQMGSEATVHTVRHVPALVIDATALPSWNRSALGGVSLYEAGLHLGGGGDGTIPPADLVEVAETLVPWAPTPTPSATAN